MTVREIFDLRKQGKIEEAYEAIKPMYAVHKGKYTTLCMFWTARDVFNKRLAEGRIEEAAKIYKALQRVLPNIDDTEGSATAFIQYAARALASIVPAGSPACPVLADSVGEINPVHTVPTASPAATVPAGSPAVSPAPTGSPACPVLADSVGEINSAPAVPAGSPAVSPAPTGSPAAAVPAGSPAVSPAVSPAPIVPAGSPAVHSAVSPAPLVPTGSAGESHSPHLGTDVPPLPWGQKKVFDCIKTYPGLSVPRISASTRIPAKSIERHIAALIDKKLIEHRGSKKTGGYYAL